jgi:hypothetical protein
MNLLEEQKDLCKSYQSKLSKLEKSNNIYSKNEGSYELERDQLIRANKRLEDEIVTIESTIK